jgi:DNA-binding MarR family transcriptional regulator
MPTNADAPLLLSVTLRLMRLGEGPATVSALAEWQAVTPPTATKVIDGLVARGWVGRLRSDGDRRQVNVWLSEVGLAAVCELEERAASALQDVLANLRPNEVCEVRRTLTALAAALPEEGSRIRQASAQA